MENKYTKSDLEYMEFFISDYISQNECEYHNMNCSNCVDIEDCYREANTRCNSEFAKSIDYGGCDSEEEFWEMLFD
jgi:hypothetical protein